MNMGYKGHGAWHCFAGRTGVDSASSNIKSSFLHIIPRTHHVSPINMHTFESKLSGSHVLVTGEHIL